MLVTSAYGECRSYSDLALRISRKLETGISHKCVPVPNLVSGAQVSSALSELGHGTGDHLRTMFTMEKATANTSD
jgi:hypothetical protein